MKIVAVIPAYNEEKVIKDVIFSVRPHVNEVVVIDDGSRDQTKHILKDTGAIVVHHLINRGQGAALQTGMEIALRRGADVIPAHQISKLVEPVINGEVDIVMGSRFMDESSNVPKLRRIILKAGAIFTRVVSGLHITDPHSGFRAMNRKAAKKLKLQQDRMAHASEILQLVSRHNLRYKEIPVTITYTDYSIAKGQSSLNAIKIVIDLIKGSML